MMSLQEVKVSWDNKQTYSQKFYRDGKLEGERKTWHRNGNLDTWGFYRNGEKHGEQKEWYGNGQMCKHSFYQNGKMEGECKTWGVNGQLNEHEFYRHDKLDGKRKSWYKNGKIEEQSFYQDGHPNGECKIWSPYSSHIELNTYVRAGIVKDFEFTSSKRRVFLKIRKNLQKEILTIYGTVLISDLSRII